MDKLDHYRQIIHQVLSPYSQIIYNNADIQNRLAFDTQNDQYLVISEGWQHNQRYHDWGASHLCNKYKYLKRNKRVKKSNH